MADDERPASAPWGRPGARDLTPPPPAAPTPPPAPAPTQAAPAWGGHPTPPPGPPPGRGGVPPLLVAALVVVAVLAVAAVGTGVYLVTSDDDEPAAGPTSTVPVTAAPTTGPASTEAVPPTSGTTTPPLGTPSTPALPGGADVAPPSELPQPDGATTDVTGGLAVPGSAEEAVAFYLDALPAAGFTATRADLAGFTTVQVTGQGLDGQLLLVDIGLGSTTVLWQAN